MTPDAPHLFINYRRDDTQWIARALYRHLSEGFGAHRVFMDRVEIRGGDQWRQKIDDALQRSTVVLAIIGRQWLTLTDEYRRLRIDREDDWIRSEIRFALNHRRRLIPLYVDGAAPITDPKHLPMDIRGLTDSQGIALTETYWDAGLYELIRQLRADGFQSHRSTIRMPERRKRVDPLTPVVLEKELAAMPGWGVTTSFVSMGIGDTPVPRTELYKEYTFNSFTEATAFMAYVSPAIDAGNHHPRWENVWTTVRVWLSTWDIEFQPSHYDVQLAHTLDEAFAAFKRSLRKE
jgi:pterin-4a-carbinolamine dehydratase